VRADSWDVLGQLGEEGQLEPVRCLEPGVERSTCWRPAERGGDTFPRSKAEGSLATCLESRA
jgi:hypothetical protein